MEWNKQLIDNLIYTLFGEKPFYYDRMLNRLYWGGIGGYINQIRFAVYESDPDVIELDFRGDTETAKNVRNMVSKAWGGNAMHHGMFEDVYYIQLI